MKSTRRLRDFLEERSRLVVFVEREVNDGGEAEEFWDWEWDFVVLWGIFFGFDEEEEEEEEE